MKQDLRIVILSVAVSTLLKRARITPNQLKAELTKYLTSLKSSDGPVLSQAELDFCAETVDGLFAGPPSTRFDT